MPDAILCVILEYAIFSRAVDYVQPALQKPEFLTHLTYDSSGRQRYHDLKTLGSLCVLNQRFYDILDEEEGYLDSGHSYHKSLTKQNREDRAFSSSSEINLTRFKKYNTIKLSYPQTLSDFLDFIPYLKDIKLFSLHLGTMVSSLVPLDERRITWTFPHIVASTKPKVVSIGTMGAYNTLRGCALPSQLEMLNIEAVHRNAIVDLNFRKTNDYEIHLEALVKALLALFNLLPEELTLEVIDAENKLYRFNGSLTKKLFNCLSDASREKLLCLQELNFNKSLLKYFLDEILLNPEVTRELLFTMLDKTRELLKDNYFTKAQLDKFFYSLLNCFGQAEQELLFGKFSEIDFSEDLDKFIEQFAYRGEQMPVLIFDAYSKQLNSEVKNQLTLKHLSVDKLYGKLELNFNALKELRFLKLGYCQFDIKNMHYASIEYSKFLFPSHLEYLILGENMVYKVVLDVIKNIGQLPRNLKGFHIGSRLETREIEALVDALDTFPDSLRMFFFRQYEDISNPNRSDYDEWGAESDYKTIVEAPEGTKSFYFERIPNQKTLDTLMAKLPRGIKRLTINVLGDAQTIDIRNLPASLRKFTIIEHSPELQIQKLDAPLPGASFPDVQIGGKRIY